MKKTDPFVAEVVRIIKAQRPWKYGKRTIILVSKQFYDIAQEETIAHEEEIWGCSNKSSHLHLCHTIVMPAPWLKDYEFEIRPPVKKVAT